MSKLTCRLTYDKIKITHKDGGIYEFDLERPVSLQEHCPIPSYINSPNNTATVLIEEEKQHDRIDVWVSCGENIDDHLSNIFKCFEHCIKNPNFKIEFILSNGDIDREYEFCRIVDEKPIHEEHIYGFNLLQFSCDGKKLLNNT